MRKALITLGLLATLLALGCSEDRVFVPVASQIQMAPGDTVFVTDTLYVECDHDDNFPGNGFGWRER